MDATIEYKMFTDLNRAIEQAVKDHDETGETQYIVGGCTNALSWYELHPEDNILLEDNEELEYSELPVFCIVDDNGKHMQSGELYVNVLFS